MEAPQWIILTWMLVNSAARIAMANGWNPKPTSPQMRMWQALGLPVLIGYVLIWGGFFPSPF